jgi:hypothetical protein
MKTQYLKKKWARKIFLSQLSYLKEEILASKVQHRRPDHSQQHHQFKPLERLQGNQVIASSPNTDKWVLEREDMIRVTHQEIDQADQILHKVLKLQDLLLQRRDKYKYSKNSIH